MKTSDKIVKVPTLKKKLKALKRKRKVIAFTNGCFDILHYGHVSYLEKAKKKDRILVVGLNSDRSIKKIKGSKRPIVPESERAKILAALSYVDFVTIFEEETPLKLIEKVQPDVLIKGADWKNKGVVGSEVVRKNGGRVEYITYLPGKSTTNIIKKVLQKCQP